MGTYAAQACELFMLTLVEEGRDAAAGIVCAMLTILEQEGSVDLNQLVPIDNMRLQGSMLQQYRVMFARKSGFLKEKLAEVEARKQMERMIADSKTQQMLAETIKSGETKVIDISSLQKGT